AGACRVFGDIRQPSSPQCLPAAAPWRAKAAAGREEHAQRHFQGIDGAQRRHAQHRGRPRDLRGARERRTSELRARQVIAHDAALLPVLSEGEVATMLARAGQGWPGLAWGLARAGQGWPVLAWPDLAWPDLA